MTKKDRAPTLGEKMLNHIAMQINGVSVSEMEASFGESRMKIGFIAKKLLEEGRIDKVKNLYFPKKLNNNINQNIEL